MLFVVKRLQLKWQIGNFITNYFVQQTFSTVYKANNVRAQALNE